MKNKLILKFRDRRECYAKYKSYTIAELNKIKEDCIKFAKSIDCIYEDDTSFFLAFLNKNKEIWPHQENKESNPKKNPEDWALYMRLLTYWIKNE